MPSASAMQHTLCLFLDQNPMVYCDSINLSLSFFRELVGEILCISGWRGKLLERGLCSRKGVSVGGAQE